VERKVAEGGMGEVWVGEHRDIRMKVALKTLLPDACLNHELVARFKREALLLGRIRSEHVGRVLDFALDEACGPVLVMEFVEGQRLADVLKRESIPVEEAIDLGIDIATALRELHRASIVHRDVKPGNVILQPADDGRRRAILVDFGLSRLVPTGDDHEAEQSVTEITRDDIAVGTMAYMAPEQIVRSRAVTGSADLYALGALLYRAVAGRHVFGSSDGAELAHTKLTRDAPPLETGRCDPVARGFEALMARALERDPAHRYECADEMLADLGLLHDSALRASRRARSPSLRVPALGDARDSMVSEPADTRDGKTSDPVVVRASTLSTYFPVYAAAANRVWGVALTRRLALALALAGAAALGAGLSSSGSPGSPASVAPEPAAPEAALAPGVTVEPIAGADAPATLRCPDPEPPALTPAPETSVPAAQKRPAAQPSPRRQATTASPSRPQPARRAAPPSDLIRAIERAVRERDARQKKTTDSHMALAADVSRRTPSRPARRTD
jgi:eukaryotic-like serine/threonine-protein kinase